MKIYTDLIQGTEEWKKARLGKITGSKIHTLLGDSKTRNTLIISLALEKLLGEAKEEYQSDAMRRGSELEAEARYKYCLSTQEIVKQAGFIELNEDVGYSPDGLVGEDKLLEIKCQLDHNYFINLLKLSNNDETGIESKYRAQMQMGMYITGRKSCDFVIYNPNFIQKPIFIYNYKRNESKIAEIQNAIDKSIKEIEFYLNKYKEISDDSTEKI